MVTLWAPRCQPWWTFQHDVRTWGDLGAQFADYFTPFGRPWGPIWYFYSSGAGPWTPFSTFLEKVWKRCNKGEKKEAEIDAFSLKFQGFPEITKCVSVPPARAV